MTVFEIGIFRRFEAAEKGTSQMLPGFVVLIDQPVAAPTRNGSEGACKRTLLL
jgi:hypothetical protein